MSSELEKLQQRKQSLLIESELHRLTLATDLTALRASTAWVDQGVGLLRQAQPILLAAAPILGFLLAGRGEKKTSLLQRALSFLQISRNVAGVWKSFRRPNESA